MKKLISLAVLFGMLAFAPAASAVEYAVQPEAALHLFDDFDEAVGFGAKVRVSDVFTSGLESNLVFGTGLEYVATEYAGGDVDVFIVPVEVGYPITIDDKLTVTPVVGVDAILANGAGNLDVDNTVGAHIGAELAVKNVFSVDNLDVVGSVKYQFAETEVNGTDASLNGVVVGGGVNYRF
jgi:hypothetical protein